MKYVISCLFILYLKTLNGQHNHKIDTIDQRIELVSIVFRLAGIEEFTVERYPDRVYVSYIARIEDYFRKHEKHAAVDYVKSKLKNKGIRYHAVMSLPINITHPPKMKPLTSFSDEIPGYGWKPATATQFLKLLNDFYDKTDFDTFYRKNQDMYDVAKKRFATMTSKVNRDWYVTFYGYNEKIEFSVVNALGIGPYNYNVDFIYPHGNKATFAIIGSAYLDSLGMPIYDDYLKTLIHEFNHSFSNPIIYENEELFKKSGEDIYKLFKKMKIGTNDAYGNWQSMLCESLVRSAVVKYLKDEGYDQETINKQIAEENKRGFPWTKELTERLNYYDASRDKYPTYDKFIPELAAFFNEVYLDIDVYLEKVK